MSMISSLPVRCQHCGKQYAFNQGYFQRLSRNNKLICGAKKKQNKFSEDDIDKHQYDYDEVLKEFIPDDPATIGSKRVSQNVRFEQLEAFGSLLDQTDEYDDDEDEEEEEKEEEEKKKRVVRRAPKTELVQRTLKPEVVKEPEQPTRRRRKLQREEEVVGQEDVFFDEEEFERQKFEIDTQILSMSNVQYKNWCQLVADQNAMIQDALTVHHDQLENTKSRYLLTLEYARIMEELDLEEAAEEEAGDVPLDVNRKKFPLWVQANYKLNENFDEWNEQSLETLKQLQTRLKKREQEEVARTLIGIDTTNILQNIDFRNLEYVPKQVKQRRSTMEELFEPVRELVEAPLALKSEQESLLQDLLPENKQEVVQEEEEEDDYSGSQQ